MSARATRSGRQAVVAASAGLLLAAVVPLARQALTDALTMSIAIVCLVLMLRTVNPLWLVVGASVTGLIASVVTRQ